MNQEAFGAEFGALTEEEQVTLIGGDGYLAGLIGYGIGYAAGSVVAGWNWINATNSITGGINVLS